MKITLIIATINRHDSLIKLLESLRRQTVAISRIILVDQNPKIFLEEALRAFHDLPLVRLCVAPCGVSAARNIGIPYIESDDVVGFPDDDCYYADDTLEQVEKFFTQDKMNSIVLGEWHVAPKPSKGISCKAITKFSAFLSGETYTQFYRGAVVKEVGLFDTRFGPGTDSPFISGEDTDYLVRALQLGHRAKRHSAIQIFHPRIFYNDINKIRGYACGRMHLLRKHRYPLWFRLAITLYPLLRIPLDFLLTFREIFYYRARMFWFRLLYF